MACNTCKKKTEDCGCKATSITIDSICNPIDCGSEECSESFAAQCILYTGEDIICDTTTVVTSGDSVAQSLANIVQFFCDRNDPTINEDILCGVDVVVASGTSLLDALVDLNNYFCNAIDTLTLFASTNSSRIGTVDPFNPLCTDYAHTITYLDTLGGTIATTNFNTRTCESLFIEDEGVPLTARDTLNFTGTGITATDTGSKIEVNVPGPTTYSLFAQTADASVTNTLISTSLVGSGVGTTSIAANAIEVGSTYEVKMRGTINVGTPVDLTIKLIVDGTNVDQVGPLSMPNIGGGGFGTKYFEIDGIFTCRTDGALGGIMSSLTFAYEENASDKFDSHTSDIFAPIDTTVINTVDIEVEWTNADPSNLLTSQIFTLTKTY